MAEQSIPDDAYTPLSDAWELVLDCLTEDEQIALAQEIDRIVIEILKEIDGGES